MKESLQQTAELALQQTLSPLQLQFSRVLEMSGAEFEDEVRRALDENPALAEAESDDHLLPLDDSGESSSDFSETADQIQRADYGSEDDMPQWSERQGGASSADRSAMFEQASDSAEETLYDLLRNQLSELELPAGRRALADYIIGEIDPNGYISRTPRQIAADLTFNLGIDVDSAQVEQAVALIQTLDPPGVGAADLRECLLLQLSRLGSDSSTAVADAITIVRDHFETFARKHFDRIASLADISGERAEAAVELLRGLSPKPGAPYAGSAADDRLRHITPDFEVDPDTDGRLVLTMNNSVPQLAIEQSFDPDRIVSGRRVADAEALAFVRRRRDEAADFIRAAEMRSRTLWKVMSAILGYQKEFFATGNPSALRPMVLRDIAGVTGYDLSVVSRATAGKYVATPYGTFPLKFFFNERVSDDSDTSSHEISAALRAAIENEDKRHPLSDQTLSDHLRELGYDIARRTVTKYREKMGLPVARLRREMSSRN